MTKRRLVSRFVSLIAKLGFNITALPKQGEILSQSLKVPGMISVNQALAYYLTCFTQSIEGDVLEIGCWQGRSTLALAEACRDSGNGRVHAIDHFQGNPGKSSLYVVGEKDLSDLKQNFQRNIARAGLADFVTLYPAPVAEVKIDSNLRLLVIDGEHTKEAVWSDFRRFRDLLVPGAVVLFDDFSRDFPAVMEAVMEIREKEPGSSLTNFRQMAVLTLPTQNI